MNYTQQEHPPEQGATRSKDTAAHRMREDLKAYQDGELSPLRRWRVGRHVEKCASCRTEIAVLQRLEQDMQELERAVPRPQLRARILASLPDAPPVAQGALPRSANPRPAFGTTRRPMLAMGGACAALLLLMVGALALNHWQHMGTRGGSGAVAAVLTPPAEGALSPDSILANSAKNGGRDSSTAQSAEPAHAPLDPFSPANSASAAPEASIAPAQIASEATGTHLSSQSSSPASGSVAKGKVSNGEEYTDPTSRLAEEMASRALPDKLEAERHNASSPVLPPAHFVQQAPKAKNGMTEATQVAFAVADLAEARRQVQMWAEETGAKITTLPYHSEGASSAREVPGGAFTPSGEATGPGHAEAGQAPALLKIQIPARQADLFKARLNEMGTPVSSPGKTFRLLPRKAMVSADDMVAAPPVRGSADGQTEAKATVTILLRLQSGSQPH